MDPVYDFTGTGAVPGFGQLIQVKLRYADTIWTPDGSHTHYTYTQPIKTRIVVDTHYNLELKIFLETWFVLAKIVI